MNGHTLSGERFNSNADYIEFWDSSADKSGIFSTGYFYTSNCSMCVVYGGTFNFSSHAFALTVGADAETTLIMYGGVVNGGMNAVRFKLRDTTGKSNLMIYGGSINGTIVVEDYSTNFNLDLSSYKVNIITYGRITYDENGEIIAIICPDYFAVSISKIVSGVYNNVYGLAWELDATALNALQVPTDKTYYLWGRMADGRYQYLNLRYDNGELKAVA